MLQRSFKGKLVVSQTSRTAQPSGEPNQNNDNYPKFVGWKGHKEISNRFIFVFTLLRHVCFEGFILEYF